MLTRAIKQDFVFNWLNNDLGAPTILYSRNERILKNNVTLKKAQARFLIMVSMYNTFYKITN